MTEDDVLRDVRAAREAYARSHNFDVRAMVLKGAITITSGNQAKTYRPGDTWDLARGCLHAESYGPEGAVVLLGRKS